MKKQINWMTHAGYRKRKSWQLLQKCMIWICLLTFSHVTFAQDDGKIRITGSVKETSGEPIIGANVIVVSDQTGTITDFDGNFELVLNSTDTKLKFSFIGFEDQFIEVKDKRIFDVVLVEDMVSLNEVIAIGYGTTKKITNTGAVSQVKGKDLRKSPAVSVSNALTGKLPGVTTIQRSGRPGDDHAEILIRGIATLDRNLATPLIIVDGVERSINDLDADEVESISVLKDASTTAVYGIRGANGVVIVTTKRGQVGKMSVNVSASYGLQSRQNMLEKANSYEFATVWNEWDEWAGKPKEDWEFSDEVVEHFRTGDDPIHYPDMDWENYLLKKVSPQRRYAMNLSGGTERVRYFVNIAYVNQEGLIKSFGTEHDHNSSFKRYNYRLNLDIDVTKRTRVSVNFGGITGVKSGNAREHEIWGRYAIAYPFSGPGIIDNKFFISHKDFIGKRGHGYNPLDRFYKAGTSESTTNSINTDFILKQDLDFVTKGLSAQVKASFNTSYAITRTRWSEPDVWTKMYKRNADDSYYLDENGERVIVDHLHKAGQPYFFEKKVGHGAHNMPVHRNWYTEGSLSYEKMINKHNISALALYNQTIKYYPGQAKHIANGVLGLVGRVAYNYDQKYLFDFNMAYNGSEVFPRKDRYGLFPSFSAGYVLSQEQFMQNLPWLAFLKVRGSWGKVGNDRSNNQRFLYLDGQWHTNNKNGANFGVDNPYIRPSVYEGDLGNQAVTWETATKYNVGFESQFFDGLFGFNFDIFGEDREGILIPAERSTPAHFPLKMPVVNIGAVSNKGYEVGLTVKKSIGDFYMHINGTISHAKNKVVYADEIPMPYDYMMRTGKKVGQNFGYRFLGFYSEKTAAEAPTTYNAVSAGDCIYEDVNKDGYIDSKDVVPIGNPTYPEFTYGLNTDFQWKNVDLSLTFSGVSGISHQVWGPQRQPFELIDRGLWKYMYTERWTPETAETATYPRITGNKINYADSDLWLRDASFMRLKSAELGYTFKIGVMDKVGVKSARIYMNGYNLLTWTKLKLWDPETSPNSNYPLIKVYNIGVNVKF